MGARLDGDGEGGISMVNSVRLLRSRGLQYVTCLAVALTACSNDAAGDKSGGEGGNEPIVLEMAVAGTPTPDAVRFADEVGRRSGGLIDIEFQARLAQRRRRVRSGNDRRRAAR